MDEEMIEAMARAISNCEWDQACSALGTPNHPRGANWSAKMPQARAAHSVIAGQIAELEVIADYLVEQQEEPWTSGPTDRLHYWRDKAINAANRLYALAQHKGTDR